MNVSVAMAYLNRLTQLRYTLKTMRGFSFTGEVVICDDMSRPEHDPRCLISEFPEMTIRVVSPEKKYINPAHAFNCALKACTREITVLQNPECCWTVDIARRCQDRLSDSKYLSFGCVRFKEWQTQALHDTGNYARHLHSVSWLNHSVHRPEGFHFCAGVNTQSLRQKLGGGFDERFNDGLWYDDNEFVFRVRRELELEFDDDVCVIHQFHERMDAPAGKSEQDILDLRAKNRTLFGLVARSYGTPAYAGILPFPQTLEGPDL